MLSRARSDLMRHEIRAMRALERELFKLDHEMDTEIATLESLLSLYHHQAARFESLRIARLELDLKEAESDLQLATARLGRAMPEPPLAIYQYVALNSLLDGDFEIVSHGVLKASFHVSHAVQVQVQLQLSKDDDTPKITLLVIDDDGSPSTRLLKFMLSSVNTTFDDDSSPHEALLLLSILIGRLQLLVDYVQSSIEDMTDDEYCCTAHNGTALSLFNKGDGGVIGFRDLLSILDNVVSKE